ncbi:AAA family ATPase [Secundilactobacillus kimchicus]|uniref:DnaB-like helicase C-terminal domain-containing protein n=1 Tax=Secundilactobacillus kimchicus TaxID=528209 RepID=UPI001C02F457|nr:DnaB-like helicase C-terminal domain-containing protein [Secundilactobacillus kimchicus]MBT9670547.1 AAA family ATPase [Secundilactobacillus kimchicus]
MQKNETLQRQLLLRGLSSPYLCKEVIGKNIVTLFKGQENLKIYARILVRHYNTSSSPMSEEVFKVALERQVAPKLKAGDLTDQDVINLFNEISTLFNEEPDESEEMSLAIEKFVRQSLSYAEIVRQANIANEDEEYDLPAILGKALEKINSIDISSQGDKPISVFEDRARVVELYSQLKLSKLPTGVKTLDEATGGGLAKGEVGLVAARSGYGKTTTLASLAVSYAKQGFNVLHITLEELEARMLLRFDRISSGMDVGQLLNADNSVNQEAMLKLDDGYRKALETGKLGKLYFDKKSPQTVTVDRVRQILRSTERENGLKFDVLLIDYPDLMLNTERTGNEAEDGSMIFQQLRTLAQSNNVLLWTATQLNRSSSFADIMTMDNVEGSFRKINTVEFAITLNRNEEEYEQGFMRYHIDKNRNREFTGDTLFVKFDSRTLRISDETEQEIAQHEQLISGGETQAKAERKQAYAQKNGNDSASAQAKASALNNQDTFSGFVPMP